MAMASFYLFGCGLRDLRDRNEESSKEIGGWLDSERLSEMMIGFTSFVLKVVFKVIFGVRSTGVNP